MDGKTGGDGGPRNEISSLQYKAASASLSQAKSDGRPLTSDCLYGRSEALRMAFTFFFRDGHTLEAITRHVIPSAAGKSSIRIWDAGCAMGPEPYSLAIMFAENMGHFAFKNLHIYATDVDQSNLFGQIISEGVYPEEQLKRIPRDIFEKYFQPADNSGDFRVDYMIRSHIHYQKHDLLSLQPVADDFILVVCKNVLLHFTAEQRHNVIKMFHQALTPGGFLAMEQTQRLPEETANLFKQVTANAQLFRKVEMHG